MVPPDSLEAVHERVIPALLVATAVKFAGVVGLGDGALFAVLNATS
jgi:hypothetical protein